MLCFLLWAVLENELQNPDGNHAKYGQLIPIGYILCYDNTGKIRLLKLSKAGVVTEAEVNVKMARDLVRTWSCHL